MTITKIALYYYITEHPGCTKREMASHFHCSTIELVKPIAALEQQGFVRAEPFQDGGIEGCFRRLKYFSKKS